uniref:G_PROTEIN_RECEP_F1_2 domain-containing protein n=1 Tax=Echinostoma caproni TaxID=27848 RepID=A0A183AH57_9TREM
LPMVTQNNTQDLGRVVYGQCPLQCDTIVLFVIVLTTCLFLTGVIQNPLLMVTMRSVNHSERSFALGLQFVIIRLLANMPSPIVFGRVIDEACHYWRYESGRRGDCAFVDVRKLNLYMTGEWFPPILCLLVLIFAINLNRLRTLSDSHTLEITVNRDCVILTNFILVNTGSKIGVSSAYCPAPATGNLSETVQISCLLND